MKFTYTLLIALLWTGITFGQSITEVHMPRYMQNSGGPASNPEKVPYICRVTINGLKVNSTYRYYSRLVAATDTVSTSTSSGGGMYTLVNAATGNFLRVTTSPAFTVNTRYAEFTTDASGSSSIWCMAEGSTSSLFDIGDTVYMRIYLNDGAGGTTAMHRLYAPSPITIMAFDETETHVDQYTGVTPFTGGTAIRSTPATDVSAKNVLMLYDNISGTGRPMAGTVIEGDGVANTIANGYAPFYSSQVNEVNKTWGTIIPNNLAGGIKRIAQYSLANGSEVGYKVSTAGTWPQNGGGTVSTVNTRGGTVNVIVLDGSVLTLGMPVLQPQTITFNALPAKTYGEGNFIPGASASSGLPVSYTSSNTSVATIVNGEIHITGAGTTNITAEQPGDDDRQAAIPVMHTLTVNKAALTITAQDVTIIQNDPIPAFTINYNGFVNGEDVNALTTAATATTAITQSNIAGTYTITPAGAVSTNYDFTYVNGTLTVNASKQSQTITFNSLPAKVYGNANFPAGATVSSNLPLTYSSSNPAVATIDNNGIIHITGTGNTNIAVSQNGNNAFFAATPVSSTLIVNPAVLTIMAENKERLLGQPNPGLSVTYSGFVNNENSSVLTALPVVTTTATVASAAGNYPITANGAAAVNYTIAYTNGTLTVLPLPAQTITFNTLPIKRYGNADFAIGATASSGLTVSYTSSNTQVATVNNGIIHIAGAGTADITASQTGDPFNAAAQPVTQTLTVQKANLVVSSLDTIKNEGQPNPAFTITYSGFVNGDDASDLATPPAIAAATTATSLAGTYPITVSGATSPNYNIAHIAGKLSIFPPNGKDQDIVNAHMSAPGKLRVNYYALKEEKISFQLFDSYGNRLQGAALSASKGFNTWNFEVGNVAAGLYFIRIIGRETTIKTKVVIR
ncbi:MBG domain-containing protein [Chitinophaga sp. SYP-B3965]|uniref:MBG domain-containing protein n=1 Tax=Chitinophaga sp. SYP-B3965 TaxID=2663120 RepID=UPI00156544DA|nr:MBG domain-containing protein [Chitinophaga sp. SYP-B3965]